MPDNVTLPALEIPVVADLAPLGKQGPEVSRTVGDMGSRAGKAFQEEFARKAGGPAGKKVAKEFTDAMERQFRLSQADTQEALARGLISPQEAEKQAREAGRRYREALLAEIKKRSAAGALSDRDFVDLTDRLAKIGRDGGTQFNEGVLDRLRTLPRLVQGVIAGGLAAAVAAGLRRIATEVSDFGIMAGETAKLNAGFSNLSTSRGLSPAAILGELRQATDGAVGSVELMRRANLLLNSELPLTAKNVGELAYLSRRLAQAVGRDAADGFDRFSRGIVKMETELLDELGIMVRVNDATKKWADENDRNVKTLTDAERQLALYNAVVEQARTKVAALGEEQADAGTRVFQAAVFWDDLKRAVVLAIAESPRVTTFFDAIGVGASNAAERVEELADQIGAVIDSGGGSLVGTIVGAAVGTAAGFASPIPGGAALGFATGAAAGSAIGQGFDAGSGAPTLAEARERRAEARAHKRHLEELRGLQDINEAMRVRSELTVRWTDLQAKGLRDTEEQKKLVAEIAAVEQAIARLSGKKTSAPPALTDGELKKIENARKALEERVRAYQALAPLREMGIETTKKPDTIEGQLQRVYEIDKEIRSIEEQIQAARGQAPAQIQQVLTALQKEKTALQEGVQAARAQWEHLPEVEARLARTITAVKTIQTAAVDTGDGVWRTAAGAIDSVTHSTKELAKAQQALTRAQLSGDPERIAAAMKKQKAAQDAVKAATAAATRVFEEGAKQGIISQLELNDLFREMVELLKQAGIETKDLTEKKRDWKDIAQQISSAGRGILSVADALGVVDDQSRRTLQGLVDVAEAAARVAANPADVGSWIQGLGGVVSVVQGLFGKTPEAKRELEQHRQAMADLSKALMSLRDAYLNTVSTEQLQADRTFAERAAGVMKDPYISFAGTYSNGPGLYAEIARRLGLVGASASQADAQAALERQFGDIDQRYGTNLGGLLKSRDFVGLLSALEKLPAEIQAQIDKLGQFGDTTADIIEKVRFQFQILGDTNAAEKLAAINAALKAAGKNAGQFQAALDELSTLNLDTVEGRARRDEIVRQMLEAMMKGGADFGSLSVEQFRALLDEWAHATGNPASGVVAGGAVDSRMAVNMTEVQANRLLVIETSMLHRLTAIDASTAAMARALLGSSLAPLTAAPLSPSSFAPRPVPGGTTVGIDRMDVQVSFPALPAGADRDALTAAGVEMGRGIAAGFRDGLTDRVRRVGRAYGIDNPGIRVTTR